MSVPLTSMSGRAGVGTKPRRSSTLVARAQVSEVSPGAKVERWLKTPFDIAAFGPRATFGALLSMPERLQTLQMDVEKVTELLQDPRPLEEKQQVVLQELEDTLVEFLERGATVESDVLANLKTVMPPEVAERLSEIRPEPPNVAVAPEPAPYDVEPTVVYTADSVAANQLVSEMAEVRSATTMLKAALEDVRENTDPSRASMLRLNLREARDMLSRRLQEIGPLAANSDASMVAAMREAGVLLNEVDAQFF